MKAQTALVRTDGAVKLDAETAVHPDFAAVVNPRNSELDNSLRLDDAVHYAHLYVFGGVPQ